MSTQKVVERFPKNQFEKLAWASGELIIGIDEVGRGCLAGPVGTAAVALFPGAHYRLLKDSKTLSQNELLDAYTWIIRHSFYVYASCDHAVIDTLNIYQATQRAMARAFNQLLVILPQNPSAVLVDAVPLQLPHFQGQVYHFIKGEQKSTSIAAASIVAKVTRDRHMGLFDTLFPAYRLSHHKGYATMEHQEAVRLVGPSLIHRTSFTQPTNEEYTNEQQSLW